jgi:hypothetical protein
LDDDKEAVRLRAAAGILRLTAIEAKQTMKKQRSSENEKRRAGAPR